MEKQFYQWYQRICMESNNELYEKRWAGVKSVYEQYKDFQEIVRIIKIYIGKDCDTEFLDGFVECFSELDHSFCSSNKEETSLLAGCVLAYCMENGNNIMPIILSLKVLAPYFNDNVLPEIFRIAEDKYCDLSLEIRNADFNLNKKQIGECGIEDFKEAIPATNLLDTNSVEQLVNVLENIAEDLKTVMSWNNRLKCEVTKYKEESQILSWLVGGWSNSLEKPLKQLNGKEAAIAIGYELASFVENYPGPFSAKALIQQMITGCKLKNEKITLTDLVDNTSREIREQIAEEYEEIVDESITPLICAIRSSLNMDEVKMWAPLFKKVAKMDSDTIKLPVLEWAIRMYYECLMINYCREI